MQFEPVEQFGANEAVLSIEPVGPNDTFVLFELVNYAK